jgi:preprotein translocase subunit SecY
MDRLWVRALVTLGAPVLVHFARGVQLPGLDGHALRELLRWQQSTDLSMLSVFALGLMPLFSSFALVELGALIVPRWRPLRHGGTSGRSSLMRATLATTLVLALIQSYFMFRYLSSVGVVTGGWSGTLVMLTLMAGVFLLIGLAQLVSRFGLLNGYVALTAGGALVSAIDLGSAGRIALILSAEPARLASYLAVIFAIAAFTWWMLGEHRRRADADELRLRMPSSGLAPLELSSGLLMLPVTLWSLGVDTQALTDRLTPGSQLYFACQVILIVIGGYFLSRWFNHPRRHAALLEQLSGPLDRAGLEQALSQLGRMAALRSAAFVSAVALASLAGTRIVHGLLGSVTVMHGGSLGTEVLLGVVLTAAIMDLSAEWRARRAHGPLVAIWPEHRLYAIDPIVQRLESAGIPVLARSAYVRALLQFFGPWVPVEIMVPAAHAERARALLPGHAVARVGTGATPADDRHPG